MTRTLSGTVGTSAVIGAAERTKRASLLQSLGRFEQASFRRAALEAVIAAQAGLIVLNEDFTIAHRALIRPSNFYNKGLEPEATWPKVQYEWVFKFDRSFPRITDPGFGGGWILARKQLSLSQTRHNYRRSMKKISVIVKSAFSAGPVVALVLFSVAGCANQSAASNVKNKPVSGYVRMTQVQAAYIGTGNASSGVLDYHGRKYSFMVGGLGIGGIGVSKIEAYGEVYRLEHVRDFPGAYAQGRYGFALGTTSSGELWLQNEKNVVMHPEAGRSGDWLAGST